MIVTTSWDDGHVLDLRLAGILDEVGVSATFYIALQNREIPSSDRLPHAAIRALSERFEIGSHSQTHVVLTRVPQSRALREMADSKAALANLTGQPIETLSYPRGAHNRRLAAAARDCGYLYARTIRDFELAVPADLWQAGVALEAARPGVQKWPLLFARSIAAGPRSRHAVTNWGDRAIDLFERARAVDGVFHLWGHSWVLERRNEWGTLRRVLRHVAQSPGVTMLTNSELARFSRRGQLL